MLLDDVAKSVQSYKKEEDLEYEKFLELHSDLGDVLPMDADELAVKQQEVRLILDRKKTTN